MNRREQNGICAQQSLYSNTFPQNEHRFSIFELLGHDSNMHINLNVTNFVLHSLEMW